MSQSHRPTRAPVCSSATARFAATVDLPTPPLPLATAITCFTPGSCVAAMPAPAPPGGAWMSIKTFVLRTPSIARNALSVSFFIVAGTFGSFVASASWTFTSPLSISMDFTTPNDTISRLNPGYFTDLSAFLTCSSEIDIHEPYVRGGSGLGGSASPNDDAKRIAEGAKYQAFRRMVIANALPATIREDRFVDGCLRFRERVPNSPIDRATSLPPRKLYLYLLDRRRELPDSLLRMRR